MYYLSLRRADENQTSVRPKRRWRDDFISALISGLTGGVLVYSIVYYSQINPRMIRIEKEIREVGIIANRALETAERASNALKTLLEALGDPNTRKELFGHLESLTIDSGQDTQINNVQESEPTPYTMEFTLTYPQK